MNATRGKPVRRTGDRNIFCPHYGECLDYVVANGWRDWDCSDCEYRTTEESILDMPMRTSEAFPYYELPLEIYLKI